MCSLEPTVQGSSSSQKTHEAKQCHCTSTKIDPEADMKGMHDIWQDRCRVATVRKAKQRNIATCLVRAIAWSLVSPWCCVAKIVPLLHHACIQKHASRYVWTDVWFTCMAPALNINGTPVWRKNQAGALRPACCRC